jgi:hypothetical protein
MKRPKMNADEVTRSIITEWYNDFINEDQAIIIRAAAAAVDVVVSTKLTTRRNKDDAADRSLIE